MSDVRRVSLLTEVRVNCSSTHCLGCDGLTLTKDQRGVGDPKRVLCTIFQQFPTPDSSYGFKRLPRCRDAEARADKEPK